MLLDHVAKVDTRDRYGATPIRRAVEQGHAQMVLLLLDRGADVNARDAGGATLLHVVAASRHVATARALLAHGIDPGALDRFGFTALDHAQGGDARMQGLLELSGAPCTIC